MVGEEFAWNMLKKGLKLTDEDVEELKNGVLAFKDMGPAYLRRAEATEKRVLAIAYYLKKKDEALWDACEQKAQQYFARQLVVDEKKSKSETIEKL